MKSFSQDNGKIKDKYYNYPPLIFRIKFKPKGQIMNCETHLYSNSSYVALQLFVQRFGLLNQLFPFSSILGKRFIF
jgi:hypothetical protein